MFACLSRLPAFTMEAVVKKSRTTRNATTRTNPPGIIGRTDTPQIVPTGRRPTIEDHLLRVECRLRLIAAYTTASGVLGSDFLGSNDMLSNVEALLRGCQKEIDLIYQSPGEILNYRPEGGAQ
jgi:hypothetical protein